jgi:hypothetical protein
MEDKFFFVYHLHMDPDTAMQMPIAERRWYIERFIKQKSKENEAMEAAKRKAKQKK